MFLEDEAVETADEITGEDTQEESTEEITTDDDAGEEEFDGEIAPEDEIELGPITVTEEQPEESSTSDKTADDTETEESDNEPKDEVDKAIYGMQKRIDKVTAQKGEKDSEIAELKAQIAELTKSVASVKEGKTSDKIYTQEQLDTAFEKAFEDGDVALMQEIRKHERENLKRELKVKNEPAQQQNQLTPQQQKETDQVVRQFGKYADKSITEVYPGSHSELDIMDPSSALRRMAMAKYHGDPKTYHLDGGMVQAVVDSYTEILNIRMGVKAKQKNTEDALLRNKVKKLQREKSQGSSSAMAGRKNNAPKKPRTQSDTTKDYVAGRKKL